MDKHPLDPYVDSERMRDVPGALTNPSEVERAFSELSSQLELQIRDFAIDRQRAIELAGTLLGTLPSEITENISDRAVLEDKLAERILKLFGQNPEAVTKEDIDRFALESLVDLGAHHTKGIVLRAAPLHDFEGQAPPEFQRQFMTSPGIVAPVTIAGQRVGQYLCLLISGVTSYFGGKNIAGWGRDKLMEKSNLLQQSDWLQDPEVQMWIETVVGASATIGITAIALAIYKRAIAEEAYKHDTSLIRAGGRVIKKQVTKTGVFPKLLAAAWIGALGYDVLSNADGFVTLTAGSVDKANQLAVTEADIDRQKDAIRSQLAGLPEQLQQQAMVFGEQEVRKEGTGGKGSSGSEGEGPLYYGKTALLTDQTAGTTGLNTLSGSVSSDVWSTLQESPAPGVTGLGIDEHEDIGTHIYSVATPTVTSVEANLAEIDRLQELLSPTEETPITKGQIADIKAQFEQILEKVGPDGTLETDLNTVMDQYNKILQSFGGIAGKYPTTYPNYKAEELETLTLPKVKVDLGSIEIKDMDYKTTWTLITEYLEAGETGKAALWAFLALFVAISLSYWNDMLTSWKVRPTNVEDRERVDKQAKEFTDVFIVGFTRTFDVLLNGPYLRAGKTEPVHPEAIEAAIREYWAEEIARRTPGAKIDAQTELADEPNIVARKAGEYAQGAKNPRMIARTETINKHNFEMQVLQDIVMDTEHLTAIIHKLLPNLDKLKLHERLNDLNTRVVDPNNIKLARENKRIERKDLKEGVHDRIPKINDKDSEEILIGKISTLLELVNKMQSIRQTTDPKNQAARKMLASKLLSVGQALFEQLSVQMAERIAEITVKATLPSIREADGKVAEAEADWTTTHLGLAQNWAEAYTQLGAGEGQIATRANTGRVNAALEGKRSDIRLSREQLDEMIRVEEERTEESRRATALRESDKKLSDALDSFKRKTDDFHRDRLDRANLLLTLIGRVEVLNQRVSVTMQQKQAVDAQYDRTVADVRRMIDTARTNQKTETVTDLEAKLTSMAAAKRDLDAFLILREPGGPQPQA